MCKIEIERDKFVCSDKETMLKSADGFACEEKHDPQHDSKSY